MMTIIICIVTIDIIVVVICIFAFLVATLVAIISGTNIVSFSFLTI